jgi:hypothetical protein
LCGGVGGRQSRGPEGRKTTGLVDIFLDRVGSLVFAMRRSGGESLVRPRRALEVRVPRTAAEWEAEPDVIRLARSYRGRRWFPRLRLFAVACCGRVWDQIPAGPPRDAVEVAERFACGLVGKRELWTAHSAAYSVVRAAVQISETRFVYGTLAEARPSVAWACTLPAEHGAVPAAAG